MVNNELQRDEPAAEQTEPALDDAFDRLLEEGEDRLARPLRAMIPTGLLGGIDVGVGVLAYFVVLKETDNHLLASIAFSIGFVALLMAQSELFTENFLVPVTAYVSGNGTFGQLVKLWVVTFVTNVIGGVLMMWVILTGRPDLQDTARETGQHYADLEFGLQSFVLAMLAGGVITLMTRMQNATDSLGVKIVPAILFGSVLVGAELFHCVLDTVFIIGAAFTGGDVQIGDLGVSILWAGLGNIVGGLALVTGLRLIRTAPLVAREKS